MTRWGVFWVTWLAAGLGATVYLLATGQAQYTLSRLVWAVAEDPAGHLLVTWAVVVIAAHLLSRGGF